MNCETFCLDDYDCIGFDLDCTLAEYNLKELMKLVYDLLAKFLINNKGYEGDNLLKPFEKCDYFLQKGLFLDLKKGTILKLAENGMILKASHGTTALSENKILEQYFEGKICSVTKEFISNPLSIINTPNEKLLRGFFDCFDSPCLVLYARIVDQLDSDKSTVLKEYNIWPDILEGLYQLYSRNNFSTGESEFFSALKSNPSLYYKAWDSHKIEWLKEVKKKKFVFMLTGSYIDFATLTATTCIGENWKDYFDVILCYARKPYFFFADHPFLKIEDGKEKEVVEGISLTTNSIYSQGNWKDLKTLISKHTNTAEPKCLYIGDNLIQDVFSPVHFNCCDSVAVSVELSNEFKCSKFWGNYFENGKLTSYWNHIIKSHAKICVSDLSVFSKNPWNKKYNCLSKNNSDDITEENGYYIS